ncbi:hypothetical protein [Saccharothrix hoggarensis]|uniref:Uncharacterized protein n=1 Tax=Saccharothrix hoggarensis TaxID=913853 RepID=A0ABW3R3W1_9PSEU
MAALVAVMVMVSFATFDRQGERRSVGTVPSSGWNREPVRAVEAPDFVERERRFPRGTGVGLMPHVSSPPPYPQGPGHGPQAWPAHPTGPAHAGPVPPPPPRRKGRAVWWVLALAAVLVAGGEPGWLALAGDERSAGREERSGGGAAEDAGCSGDYCIGKYRYVNACGLLDPSGTASRIGPAGDEGLLVQESFIDPLPAADPASPPTWPFSARSHCDVRPVDYQEAVFRSLSLELEQYGVDGAVEAKPAEQGRSLPGIENVAVQDGDGGVEVFGWVRNTRFRLNLVWSNKKPPIPEATITALVDSVVKGVANAPSAAADLGELREGGRRVVTDACAVFTGADFQDAVDYAVDPTNVDRGYHTALTGSITRTCRRTTAPPDRERPAPEGTTYLDGSMSPKVTVTQHVDAAAARAAMAEDRRDIAGAVDVPGVGDGAVFGAGRSSFSLVFTKGFHQVRIDCGLSNGNADWTPADMRARLEPLAAAVAARVP